MPRYPSGPRSFLTDEEKQQKPKVTGTLLKRILSYLAPYWMQLLFVFAAIFLAAAAGLLPSVVIGKIVDEALTGSDMGRLLRLVLLAFMALAASQVIGVSETYVNSWISGRIVYDMKNQMYGHLQHMPHSFFTTEKQGDILTRLNSDISGVSGVISGTLAQAAGDIATIVTTLAALFSMNWPLALAGVVVVPLFILPTRSAGRVRWKLAARSQQKQDEMNEQVGETLSVSGALLVRLLTREKTEYDKFRKLNEEHTALAVREARSGTWFRVFMGLFSQLGPLLIYSVGGWLMISRLDASLSVGTVTAMVALVNRLYRPVQSVMNLNVSFVRSLALFTRIFDYLDRMNPLTEKPHPLSPPLDGAEVRFSGVSFGYTQDREILRDLSFAVPGGKMYALVGPSGSGKSTIVSLIPRLYDVKQGRVSVAGVDVRDFSLNHLRGGIGMVTQDSHLFNGSVLDNLLAAKPGAAQEEVESACRAAGIHGFIAAQPEGYQTQVGARGLRLSGGEKQRLSIARAILRDPKILILDEATSSLDSITENAVRDALEKLMRGRTSIVIAHRLSTVLAADRILVVSGGKIAEEDSHEELLMKGGLYRELYETQFREVIDREGPGESRG